MANFVGNGTKVKIPSEIKPPLKNHMLYHQSDRRTFFCQHQSCSMSFVEQRHLDRHVHRIHHGVRRYACRDCGRQSIFRKVRVKLSSQVSMSPPSSVNKKRFAAWVCGLLPKFEVAVLAFEKKSQPRRWRRLLRRT